LQEIRSLTVLQPAKFCPRLKEIGERCGVAFEFIPEFKGFPFTGLTRWLKKNPIVQVNLRGKRSDILWFSIMHEIGHVLLHSDFRLVMSLKNVSDTLEKEADRFADDVLIPPEQYNAIRDEFVNSESFIMEWAEKLGIEPGILVGRLKHDRVVKYNQFAHLHRRLEWM
jgi:HTH-type transcriptional regulator/antitoxin HigA